MNASADRGDPGAGPGYAILVVDDDAESLRYVGDLLITHGFRVHVATNGRLAIDIAREVQPDLILLDIRMPGLDGIETCRGLKRLAETRAIPVIFLTGRDDEPSMLEAFDAGGADYLVKPFEARILLARVRTHAELGALSRGLEQSLAERTRALRHANAELRRLAADVSVLEETEKARLAAALHDGPMQKLAMAQMQIAGGIGENHVSPAAKGRAAGIGAEGRERLAAGLALLREAITELRTLQVELSPPVLHQRGLAAALEWLAGDTRTRWGIDLDCVVDADLPTIDRQRSVILFQCARELVHNLIKHSGARGGAIGLTARADHILLTVVDHGHGFDASARDPASREARGGFGLYSVRERLAALGGSLAVHSDDGGSRLSMRLPLVEAGVAAAPSPTARAAK